MKKSLLNRFKEKHYKLYKRVTVGTLIVASVIDAAYLGLAVDNKIEGNKSFYTLTKGAIAIQNENEEIALEEEVYDEKLKEYASQFDTSNMSETEIIVTVMRDIRENTYYDNSFDRSGIGNNYRLVLDDNNNHGVCRHMADKFTTIMNLIDPEYDACDMVVNMVDGTYPKCNIYGLESNDPEFYNNYSYEPAKLHPSGNHLVTVIKSKEHDCYFVVDVTRPAIGVLENGKIHLFNDNSTESLKYQPYGQIFRFPEHDFEKVNEYMIDSYSNDYNYDELDSIYGLDAQNKMLEKIK